MRFSADFFMKWQAFKEKKDKVEVSKENCRKSVSLHVSDWHFVHYYDYGDMCMKVVRPYCNDSKY